MNLSLDMKSVETIKILPNGIFRSSFEVFGGSEICKGIFVSILSIIVGCWPTVLSLFRLFFIVLSVFLFFLFLLDFNLDLPLFLFDDDCNDDFWDGFNVSSSSRRSRRLRFLCTGAILSSFPNKSLDCKLNPPPDTANELVTMGFTVLTLEVGGERSSIVTGRNVVGNGRSVAARDRVVWTGQGTVSNRRTTQRQSLGMKNLPGGHCLKIE